jgi:multicomponent Na+:H+ antiporter subunit A
MLVLVFILPLLAALLCLALDRAAPTRLLGIGAAMALLIGGLALMIVQSRGGPPSTALDYTWAVLDERPIRLTLRIDEISWPFVLLVLGGGGLGMLTLAFAVPPELRGFGGLFAAILLALTAVAAGLANAEPLLLPFIWALATLLIVIALRASGALAGREAPLILLLAGLLGALLLLGAALVGENEASVVLAIWTIVALIALGAPPFHSYVDALAEAPAALAGMFMALGLPLLGGYALIRFAAAHAPLPHTWQIALTLLGIAALLICATGAVGTTSLRRLTGWQLSAQMGLLLVAVAHGSIDGVAVAPTLLANTALATLACLLAIAPLERRAGTDDLAELTPQESLGVPGLAFLVGAASMVGLPGTWGFWPHRWLLGAVQAVSPWALPPLLAGGALLAFGYAAPLAAFWRAARPRTGERPQRSHRRLAAAAVVCAVAALPLLALGVAQAAEGARPRYIALAAGLILLPIAARFGRRRAAGPDQEAQRAAVFAPHALGQSLGGLAWLGSATGVFLALWAGLLTLSRAIRRGLALLEQRYYLAGLVIALIIVIMLFVR